MLIIAMGVFVVVTNGSTDATLLYDLTATNADNNRYSFIFEGNSQALDHIYVTSGLMNGASADYVHVNNDFSRLTNDVTASDHEPVIAWFAVGAECIDSDGDGWGWNGTSSCRTGEIVRGACIDTDGDGYGWNGVDTCIPDTAQCIDTDGDGWGWTGTQSCRIGEIPVEQCVDVDGGGGFGWNGVATNIRLYPSFAKD